MKDAYDEITKDARSRLISAIYQGYVRNRNKEMDRIDNSTGWSIGILVLMLTFMLTSGVPYYYVPLSFIILLPFWIKESRRYVYYMFWSKKESDMESQIQATFEHHKYDKKGIIKALDFRRPDKMIKIYKAFKVRFYRSYFWMMLLIYMSTLILAITQEALGNTWIMLTFTIGLIIITWLGFWGFQEMIMPRRIIMHLGIKESKYDEGY